MEMKSRHSRSMSIVVDNRGGAPGPSSIHGIHGSNGNYGKRGAGGAASGGGYDKAVPMKNGTAAAAAAAAAKPDRDHVQLPSSPPLNLYAVRPPTPTPTPTLGKHCKLCDGLDPVHCNCCLCIALYPPPSPPPPQNINVGRRRYIRDANNQFDTLDLRRSGRRASLLRSSRFGPSSSGQRTADSVPEVQTHMVKVVAEYDARKSAAGNGNRNAGQLHAAAAADNDDDEDDDEDKDNGCGTKTINFCMQCIGCNIM